MLGGRCGGIIIFVSRLEITLQNIYNNKFRHLFFHYFVLSSPFPVFGVVTVLSLSRGGPRGLRILVGCSGRAVNNDLRMTQRVFALLIVAFVSECRGFAVPQAVARAWRRNGDSLNMNRSPRDSNSLSIGRRNCGNVSGMAMSIKEMIGADVESGGLFDPIGKGEAKALLGDTSRNPAVGVMLRVFKLEPSGAISSRGTAVPDTIQYRRRAPGSAGLVFSLSACNFPRPSDTWPTASKEQLDAISMRRTCLDVNILNFASPF